MLWKYVPFEEAGSVRFLMLWIHIRIIQGSRDQLAFDQSPGLIAVFHALWD
jgi:hypothetical protein